jgi:hypothetical protein
VPLTFQWINRKGEKMGEQITDGPAILPDFRLLPVPMPLMLPNVIGINSGMRPRTS